MIRQDIRLSPEQAEHVHPLEVLSYDVKLDVFICGECGAELVIPELSFAIRLTATSKEPHV